MFKTTYLDSSAYPPMGWLQIWLRYRTREIEVEWERERERAIHLDMCSCILVSVHLFGNPIPMPITSPKLATSTVRTVHSSYLRKAFSVPGTTCLLRGPRNIQAYRWCLDLLDWVNPHSPWTTTCYTSYT